MPIKVGTTSIKVPFSKAYVGNALVYSSSPKLPLLKTYVTNTTQTAVPGVASTADYILVAGGNTPIKTVTAYSHSLTTTSAPDLTTQSWWMAAVSFNGYAVFAGGKTASGGGSRTNQCLAYSNQLVKSTLPTLWDTVFEPSAVATNTSFMVAGGSNYSAHQTKGVVYDLNFTKSSATNMSVARWDCQSAAIGNTYKVYCGCPVSSSGNTDFYDNSNVKTTSTNPYGKQVQYSLGISTPDYAIFFGGCYNASSTKYKDCKAYDINKVLTSFNLPIEAFGAQGFCNGEYTWVEYGSRSFTYDNNLVLIEDITYDTNIQTRAQGRESALSGSIGLAHSGDSSRYNVVEF